MHVSGPPGAQKIGDAASIASSLTGDIEQVFEGETDAIFHAKAFAERSLTQIKRVGCLNSGDSISLIPESKKFPCFGGLKDPHDIVVGR
jgi:hypothetical protein